MVLPAILSQLTLIMMETVSMMFIGRLDNNYATAGFGLGLIYINCTTQATLTGLNNSISVLVAVAYGRRDMKECEQVFQRGRVLCFLFFLPLGIVMMMCYQALCSLGIDAEVASYAHKFGFYLYFAIGFHMQFDCYRQYLNATNNSRVVQYAVSSTLLFHVLLCYLLTEKLDLGVEGVGIATIVTCAGNFLFLVFYC